MNLNSMSTMSGKKIIGGNSKQIKQTRSEGYSGRCGNKVGLANNVDTSKKK